MADLEKICQEIADVLDTIPELNGMVVHELIQTPAAIVEPQMVDYQQAMNHGLERWEIIIRILSSTASERAGHEARFEFFGGTKDIKDLLESHVPFRDGTVTQDIFVRQASNFGAWEISGVAYIGGEIAVDVYA